MKPAHYDGKLSLYTAKLRPKFPVRIVEIQDETGAEVVKWSGFDGVNHRTKKETKANARRLVACWNALQGVSTATIEESIPELNTLLRKVQAERDCMKGALLWLLWRHQGRSSIEGQAIRKLFGIGACAKMTKEQVSIAKRFSDQM